MDNFTIWVDAPSKSSSESHIDDEPTSVLRKEIEKTQQDVIKKLDEQESREQERGDQAEEETTNAFKIASQVADEERRLRKLSQDLVVFRDVCTSNELQFLAIKNDFPNPDSLSSDNHEEALFEVDSEISKLSEYLAARARALQELDLSGNTKAKEDAKKECQKIREIILEAKRKHMELRARRSTISRLQAEYDEAVSRKNQEKEEIELAKEALKNDQEYVEKLTEECVHLRSQLVQVEAAQSNKQAETDQQEIERLQLEMEQIQRETEEITSKTSEIKKEIEEVQIKLEARKKQELENKELIAKRKEGIISLLRKKIEEEKIKKAKKPELLKLLELKKALNKEKMVLKQAQTELEKVKVDNKSVSQIKSEIAKVQTEIRSHEREIKKLTKENEQVIEQIAKMKQPSRQGSPVKCNDTAEIDESEYSQNIVTPQLEVNITPVQRAVSRDVFTGAPLAVQPLMTSTPLHRNERSVNTRAAARRLDKNAAAKTAEIRKKRGGKK